MLIKSINQNINIMNYEIIYKIIFCNELKLMLLQEFKSNEVWKF